MEALVFEDLNSFLSESGLGDSRINEPFSLVSEAYGLQGGEWLDHEDASSGEADCFPESSRDLGLLPGCQQASEGQEQQHIVGKKKRGRKRKVPTDDPVILKEIHKTNEKRRRDDIRSGFEALRSLVPGLDPRSNNSVVLDRTVQHLSVLQEQHNRMERELVELRSALRSPNRSPTRTEETSSADGSPSQPVPHEDRAATLHTGQQTFARSAVVLMCICWFGFQLGPLLAGTSSTTGRVLLSSSESSGFLLSGFFALWQSIYDLIPSWWLLVVNTIVLVKALRLLAEKACQKSSVERSIARKEKCEHIRTIMTAWVQWKVSAMRNYFVIFGYKQEDRDCESEMLI